MAQTVIALLQEYTVSSEVGYVYLNFGRAVRIVKRQNGCFCERLFERSECCFLIFSPAPERVLLYKVIEQAHFTREVLNESAIEVGEAEEFLNIPEIARFQPVGDYSGFSMIYAYTTRFNNHVEVLNAITVECRR